MRYRTAAILSAVLVLVNFGMFSLPAVAWAVLLPSMERPGVDPPFYIKLLYVAAEFCSMWKWIVALLTPPIVVVLFVIAALTGGSRAQKAHDGQLGPSR